LQLLQAAATFSGSTTIGRLHLQDATLDGGGAVQVTDDMTWHGGRQSGAGSTVILAGSSLLVTAGSDDPTLIDRLLEVNGTASFSNGILQTAGNARVLNHGTLTFGEASGVSSNGNDTRFDLAAGASLIAAAHGDPDSTAGRVLIDAGQISLDGDIELASGALVLQSRQAGIHEGVFAAAPATLLRFNGQHSFASPSSIAAARLEFGSLGTKDAVNFSGSVVAAWDAEEVEARLESRMKRTYAYVLDRMRDWKTDMRTACYAVALERVRDVYRGRGLWP
jgi:hypothetical protein